MHLRSDMARDNTLKATVFNFIVTVRPCKRVHIRGQHVHWTTGSRLNHMSVHTFSSSSARLSAKLSQRSLHFCSNSSGLLSSEKVLQHAHIQARGEREGEPTDYVDLH